MTTPATPQGTGPRLQPAEHIECDREQEVFDVVRAGRWPGQCDEEIVTHVASCESCADLAEVASTVLDDSLAAVRAAHVPSSGAMWWRAQRRFREEGVQMTSRAMTFVQAITVLCGVFIAVSLIGALSPDTEWMVVAERFVGTIVTTEFFEPLAQWGLPVALLLVASAAAMPVAAYFALGRD